MAIRKEFVLRVKILPLYMVWAISGHIGKGDSEVWANLHFYLEMSWFSISTWNKNPNFMVWTSAIFDFSSLSWFCWLTGLSWVVLTQVSHLAGVRQGHAGVIAKCSSLTYLTLGRGRFKLLGLEQLELLQLCLPVACPCGLCSLVASGQLCLLHGHSGLHRHMFWVKELNGSSMTFLDPALKVPAPLFF